MMTSFPSQYFPVPSPVIRLKLTFHSDESIPLPRDTWHLMEFTKSPLVADVIDQIRTRFQFQKKFVINLGMKGAIFLKSEKSLIFRDEDTITVDVSSNQRSQKTVEVLEKPNSLKRKTGVVGSAPNLTNQLPPDRPPKKAAVQESTSSSSSDQSDKNKKPATSKSVLFIPRQVPASKPSAIHSTQVREPTNENSDSSESSSSSEPDPSAFLQKGARHLRFKKHSKQPITLRPRGRGRAFGRVPKELTNRIGPPPPIGRGRDKFTCRSEVFVNKPEQQQHQQSEVNIEKEEVIEKEDFSQLKSVTSELPPRLGDTIVFKILEMSTDYSPIESNFRKAKVLSYDPNDEKVVLEYTQETIEDIKINISKRNEGKFEMEQMETAVQDNFKLSELIDPRLLKLN